MKRVLFVSTDDAGPGPMAEALFNALVAHGRADARAGSCGLAPARAIRPEVLAAMQELDIDLSAWRPRPLKAEPIRSAWLVVALDCEPDAQRWPGLLLKDIRRWDLGTAAEVDWTPDGARRVRGALCPLVDGLVGELAAATPSDGATNGSGE